jgi:hypothetical protein
VVGLAVPVALAASSGSFYSAPASLLTLSPAIADALSIRTSTLVFPHQTTPGAPRVPEILFPLHHGARLMLEPFRHRWKAFATVARSRGISATEAGRMAVYGVIPELWWPPIQRTIPSGPKWSVLQDQQMATITRIVKYTDNRAHAATDAQHTKPLLPFGDRFVNVLLWWRSLFSASHDSSLHVDYVPGSETTQRRSPWSIGLQILQQFYGAATLQNGWPSFDTNFTASHDVYDKNRPDRSVSDMWNFPAISRLLYVPISWKILQISWPSFWDNLGAKRLYTCHRLSFPSPPGKLFLLLKKFSTGVSSIFGRFSEYFY